MDEMLRFFSLRDANVQFVLLGSLLLGASGGLLGSFALLRKRSLLGDALAHAALPGIVLAFMITGSKSILSLLLGASLSGILGVLIIQAIVHSSRIKPDAALGLVLSVFFGVGIVLLTRIQRQPNGNQSGLDKFLFGQAASLIQSDLIVMGIISLVLVLVVILFFKEFRLLCFDVEFLSSLGYNAHFFDLLLMSLIVLAVMVGLQAVGVVLMAAMLITPAAAARFWTNNLTHMVIIAAILGGISGILGTFISSLAPRIPTGPVMVLAATLFFILSALFAPKRGLLAKTVQRQKNRLLANRQHLLRALIELQEIYQSAQSIASTTVASHLNLSAAKIRNLARKMAHGQLITIQNDNLSLTPTGAQQAKQIVKTHRLWEYYLVHRAALAPDHVHRDADEMEHILPLEVLDRLEEILKKEGVDTDAVGNIHRKR